VCRGVKEPVRRADKEIVALQAYYESYRVTARVDGVIERIVKSSNGVGVISVAMQLVENKPRGSFSVHMECTVCKHWREGWEFVIDNGRKLNSGHNSGRVGPRCSNCRRGAKKRASFKADEVERKAKDRVRYWKKKVHKLNMKNATNSCLLRKYAERIDTERAASRKISRRLEQAYRRRREADRLFKKERRRLLDEMNACTY
jgi:hypothetical protein